MNIKEPTVGPIIGWTTTNSARLWARGDETSQNRTFGAARIRKSGEKSFGVSKIFKMMPVFDYTGIIDFDGLSTNQNYYSQIGYFLPAASLVTYRSIQMMIGAMPRTAPSGRRFPTQPIPHPLFLGHAGICCACSVVHSLTAAGTRPSD